ncbi:hypothetical protein [Oligosphaera ethanolica]|uniref:Uncharacterized protein n=1 Tax=Oligosphaera ethanolica TaxID=760260 RepID=A0AAE3VHQ5_9BACT|nr:hypothetical protein [Oligosphaera ethanolica]MDQ0290645.1 hypothetical protein [Oligosphaera ethanolica]
MDKESQDTKTPWRRPAKGKFIALIPNDAGIIEPVEINTGKEDVTLGEVRRAVYHRALEVVQWVREALDETPQTPENEQWRHGLIWMGELGVDVMNIVNSPGINKPGTVLDLDIIVDIYELALSCSFIGRCHQLAELADVLTAEQLQRKTFSMLSDMRREHADHDARTTAEHREHDTKLEGMDAKVTATRNEAREQLPGRVTAGMAAAALCKAFASAKLDPEATATKLRQRLRKAKLKDVITLDNRGTKAYRIADVLDIVKAHCAASRKPGSMDPGDVSRFLAELTDIPGRVRNQEET